MRAAVTPLGVDPTHTPAGAGGAEKSEPFAASGRVSGAASSNPAAA